MEVDFMKERVRTMANELDVKGTYIMEMFLRYQENKLFINRKYQRKLVWTVEEKQEFINTILGRYPVPLFLLVKYKAGDNKDYQYDVIDGLQRLDAIFSFIKNEFPARGRDGKLHYFNVDALAGSADIVTAENIKVQENVFDMETSRMFLNYELPVSTTEASDQDIINIFKRINSTGRKLSKQDLRQAGAVGEFVDLVRKTACEIRGDVTEDDVVLFRKMPELSLSNKKLRYIDIRQSFWMKQGILTPENIRISRDEELVARIYGYILLGKSVSPSSKTVDLFYSEPSMYYQKLNCLVREQGSEYLMGLFLDIYRDIIRIVDSVNMTFEKLLFVNSETRGKSKVFLALFLTLYELWSDHFVINDYREAAFVLKGAGNREFKEITDDDEWNADVRNTSIRRLKSILQPKMVKRLPAKPVSEWEQELEKMLSSYGAEQQMYDFKLGLTNLENGQRNPGCITKIVKTLTAMVNTHPEKTATVLLGVANDLSAAQSHKDHYGVMWVEYKRCYVTGIESEMKKYWKNDPDAYKRFIRSVVEKEPIRGEYKDQILKDMHMIEYKEKMLLVITFKGMGSAVSYDKKYYDRHDSHLHEVELGSAEFDAMVARVAVGKKDVANGEVAGTSVF